MSGAPAPAIRPGGAACALCEVHAESVFKVDGMDCHEEVAILRRRLQNLAGLEDLSADVVGQRLLVKYDAARLTTAAITDAVADTGMRAWLEHEHPRVVGTSSSRRLLVWLSGIALATGLAANWAGLPGPVVLLLFGLSVGTGGVYPARRALGAVRTRTVDINVLMSIAVAGAVGIGEWSEAATVVFLFALAQYLESRSMDRARNAIRALMDLTPPEAVVVRHDVEVRVAVDEVQVGDLLRLKPGAKVPLDGVVVSGTSEVNQAPITGESLPVEKQAGDEVFAGTINGHGALDMRVTRGRRDTTLARIIHLVETAQAQRAPAQVIVDRFARWYTPAVIGLAVVLSTVVPFALGQPYGSWFYRALVLLVIACPCALVISTPVSIVSALAAAARQGVLIKGGSHLERLAAIRCIAFDKTGTLTRGTPSVLGVQALDGTTAAEVLALAAGLESRSEHPIAAAVAKHASAAGVTPLPVDRFTAVPGRGAEGIVAGQPVVVGNVRLFAERDLLTPDVATRAEEIAASGRTVVLVARGGRAVGAIEVADRPRETGRDVMDLLRQHGLGRLVMLTGDHSAAASAIAGEIGIDEVKAELLPQDKVAAVGELRAQAGSVAMVGDGVNDAPALAAADVGIVMGAAGSDAALETADVALMADELARIPYAIRLSRATVRNIRVNLTIALSLKLVFLALAVTGHATLWMAIVADTGASLLVIANGLRLLRTT